MSRPTYLLNLPETDYRSAHALQTAANAGRHTGRLDRDLVIMLEHPPVFTLGRRGGRQNLIVSEEVLQARRIEIVPVERGGDITYHGPGQLVVYLVMDLMKTGFTVKAFVDALEKAMVGTAAHWGIQAAGNEVQRGAWVERRKLGSVGITIRRGITFHGLALNANTDLEPFTWINPCGIQGCTMTSLARETGRAVDLTQVRARMAEHLERQFGLRFEALDLQSLEAMLKRPTFP
jgi:lipoate-protein ligase B